MRSARPRPARAGLSAAVLVFAIVALLVNIPVPAKATGVAPATPAGLLGAYTVTWNSADVSSASGASSALAIDLAQTATIVYSWHLHGAGAVNVSDARLQMFYFGFAVSTRDVIETNPVMSSNGNLTMSWAPLSVGYLLEGTYRLTASFLAPNGTTLWSENFYVRGTAPFGIGALIPIVLLILIVYELVALVRSGRYAALGRPPASPPPASPPASTPPGAAEAAPPGPTEGTAPPSGGGA